MSSNVESTTQSTSYAAVNISETQSDETQTNQSLPRITGIRSVCERLQTAGCNVVEASKQVLSWMHAHPWESGIIVTALTLASGSVLLAGAGIGAVLAAPSKPEKVACESLKPFTFDIGQGHGFSLKDSLNNTQLFHKKTSDITFDTQFTLDSRSFCEESVLANKAFIFHCDTDGKDYTLSAKNIKEGEVVLNTGKCSSESKKFQQYFDCKKSELSDSLECTDNVSDACKNLKDFQLTLKKSSKNSDGISSSPSFFFTKDNGKDFLLFYSNFDNANIKFNISLTPDCNKLLDTPLQFECSSLGENSVVKKDFTVRKDLLHLEGSPSFVIGTECTPTSDSKKEEKVCTLKFDSHDNCGGALDEQASCDKVVVLHSFDVGSGSQFTQLSLQLKKETRTHNFATATLDSTPAAKEESAIKTCHNIIRKPKEGYTLTSIYAIHPGGSKESKSVIPEQSAYNTITVNFGSVSTSLEGDTSLPKEYERPCGIINVDHNNPGQQNIYSTPLCNS